MYNKTSYNSLCKIACSMTLIHLGGIKRKEKRADAIQYLVLNLCTVISNVYAVL